MSGKEVTDSMQNRTTAAPVGRTAVTASPQRTGALRPGTPRQQIREEAAGENRRIEMRMGYKGW